MAVTIKLKNASGSDPSASDLVVGEVALRTDSGKLFTKKDNGNVAEIGGSGISDGDKGDITVSNGGDTFTIDSGVVTSAKIADGAIVNADINASAGISFSKMSVLSANTIVGRRVSNGVPQELTAGQVRTILNVEDGATADQTASEIRALVESASDSNVFTDADHSKLNGIASGATNVTNTNQLTNGAGFITATLTNEQVQDIVGGMVSGNTESGITVTYQDGDGTLDFSVASQTDNNFTNADHSKLDGIEAGATADQSASEILTLLKTVDGSGSGLDADTLDGISSGSFARSDASDTLSGNYTFTSSSQYPITIGSTSGMNNGRLLLRGATSPYIQFKEGDTDKAFIQWHSDGYFRIGNEEDGSQLRIQDDIKFSLDGSTFYKVWHAGNDGSGSGLDADTLDGVSSGSYLRSDANDTFTSILTLSSNARDCVNFSSNSTDDNRGIAFNGRIALSADYNDGYLRLNNASEFSNGVYTPLVMRADGGFQVGGTTVINNSGNIAYARLTGTPTIPTNNNQLTNGAGYITSANGGNAATLDSLDSTDFLRSSAADTASSDITFSGGAGAATIAAGSDIRFTNGDWTGNVAGKIQHHSNILYIQGGSNGIYLRSSGGTNRAFIDSSGHFLPAANNTYNLGSSSNRWSNLFVNDMHFANSPENPNKVDGTWGDWTLQEGEDQIYMLNNRNGKKYAMNLTEIV